MGGCETRERDLSIRVGIVLPVLPYCPFGGSEEKAKCVSLDSQIYILGYLKILRLFLYGINFSDAVNFKSRLV